MRRLSLVIAVATLALAPSSVPAQVESDPGATYDDDRSLPEHAEDVVDYTMRAELEPKDHTVHGEGTITWRNTSSAAVSEVWVHLYLNAFKNQRSTFMREPAAGFRGSASTIDWGAIDVRKLSLDGVDLWPTADKTGGRPGDEDETDVRVPLPHEVPAGGSVTFDVVWDDKLPSIVERTGYHGSFHMIAQWFPKIARLEPDGRWAHFPFHHLAEFYSDFGTYDVTLKAPKSFVLGATGEVVESHDEGGLHVERHVQRDVHDFAWTAWDQFQERDEKVAGTRVRILYPRGYGYVARRELDTIRFGLPHYGERYGRYPYPILTVVHPPAGAEEAGGMEYPTLITTGGPWYGPPGVDYLELVTIHEMGHQWFYGMLASDEVTWPFLDEGLNSYAEQEAVRAWKGEGNVVHLSGLDVDDGELDGAWPGVRVHDAPVAQPAFDFPTGGHYGALVYERTAAIFETIDRVYGKDRGARAIGRYARRCRFHHPTPEDLLASYEEVLGPDVRATLEEALFHEGWVNFRVEAIHSEKVTPALSIFDKNGKREVVKETGASGGSAEHEGWVLVAREGTLVLPVTVELTFEDGRKQRIAWDGVGDPAGGGAPQGKADWHWARLPFHASSGVAYAVVDPDHAVLLEQDRLDDFMRASDVRPKSDGRVTEKLLYGAQLLFGTLLP